ncbi:cell division protein FtsL [Candidatus Enterococcus courvalinii]|uniref:Cell division protein FtsL n=1 Tax=Candidatus Enterococcus courvalinii TaxID=2815329 RepID=A0ABS3I300_9ENTE|nr:cell division protein FtsL [Enterococcus sp. MSG2901]MBO0483082.1 cell division protein FtsL [Enterococcus sp. MSG2901]
MAELKRAHEYPYDFPDMVDQAEQLPDSSQEIVLPQSPARRLKRISNLEKLVISGLIVALISLSVLTIMLRTNISGAEQAITSIQADITEKKTEKTTLEQEKNELSRTERVKQIAEEKGLSINDDNLRKVK